jgi:hypothetical protein
MVGLAKRRLADAAALGTTRVVGRRARRGAAVADAAEAGERGFVRELERSPERVYLPGRKDPVVLRRNSAELFLLERLRDEAHRFAIGFHRKLRRERNFQSVLEEIQGIGEGRKRALLRHFGSLRGVRQWRHAGRNPAFRYGPSGQHNDQLGESDLADERPDLHASAHRGWWQHHAPCAQPGQLAG